MPHWIRGIYIMVLKEGVDIKDIGIFQEWENDSEAFAIRIGDWWDNPMVDHRYMHIQEYIDAVVDKTII